MASRRTIGRSSNSELNKKRSIDLKIIHVRDRTTPNDLLRNAELFCQQSQRLFARPASSQPELILRVQFEQMLTDPKKSIESLPSHQSAGSANNFPNDRWPPCKRTSRQSVPHYLNFFGFHSFSFN